MITGLVIFGILYFIRAHSSVLTPFFIAVFLVYLFNPFVRFIQFKLRVKKRIPSVILAMLTIIGGLSLIFFIMVPQFVNEMIRMGGLIQNYTQKVDYKDIIPGNFEIYLKDYIEKHKIEEYFKPENLSVVLEKATGHIWSFISGSVQVFSVFTGIVIVMLYMVFLLIDFENLEKKWPTLLPSKYRPMATSIVNDLQKGMNTYFRMQGLISLIAGTLFAIGFKIIGLPLAITMGILMGLLNMVPYMYLLGIIPGLLLALLSALDSENTFLHEAISVLIVIGSVQLFQDLVLLPRIMGRAYNLNPAVMLLSLSIWGSLLGFIGLLLALPLTTILISYYRRYILNETNEPEQQATLAEPVFNKVKEGDSA
jgi:predicted PurR-regulated permease PerM